MHELFLLNNPVSSRLCSFARHRKKLIFHEKKWKFLLPKLRSSCRAQIISHYIQIDVKTCSVKVIAIKITHWWKSRKMTSVLCNNELNIFFFYSQFSCGDDDDVDANKNYYYGEEKWMCDFELDLTSHVLLPKRSGGCWWILFQIFSNYCKDHFHGFKAY